MFQTTAPYMYDGGGADSLDIAVTLRTENGKAYITYTPDAAWLASPERVYPVTIDPDTVNVAQTALIDTYVVEGLGNAMNQNQDRLWIGNKTYGGSSSRYKHSAYWRVTGSYMPSLPSAYTINSATFSVRLKDGTSTMQPIYLMRVSSYWSSSGLTSPPSVSTQLGVISGSGSSRTPPSGLWLNYSNSLITEKMLSYHNSI